MIATTVAAAAAVVTLALGAAGCGPGATARPARPARSAGLPVTAASAPALPTPSGSGLRARFLTATGAVFSFDPVSRVLVLRSAGGESRFVVAPEARLWVGSRRTAVDRLAGSAGAQATVAYSEADGVLTTHTVRLARGRSDRER